MISLLETIGWEFPHPTKITNHNQNYQIYVDRVISQYILILSSLGLLWEQLLLLRIVARLGKGLTLETQRLMSETRKGSNVYHHWKQRNTS
jgi:hypothetical protein